MLSRNSSSPRPIRPIGRSLILAVLLLPGSLQANPGLRLDPLYGPLADLVAPVSEPPQAFLAPMLGGINPLGRKVKIDSTGVIYTPIVAGFPAGPAITINMEEHIHFTRSHALDSLWTAKIRREFRATANQQGKRSRGGGLQWNVPFPKTPAPLRRIIGDEGPQLNINGQLEVAIAGKSEWTAGEVQTAAGRASKFPSLSMEQEQKFTVEGKVGELINIRIDQATQSFNTGLGDQLANQIKLDFKGDEDAIFQEIQAGNTTLSLPGTRFVGFRQQHKGLFGIRAKGHLGSFDFTTIASHEKSKSNRQTFRGGATADTVGLADYQYVRNKFFYLDHLYRDRLQDFRKIAQGGGGDLDPDDFIDEVSLVVYINDFNTRNDPEKQARPGIALVDTQYTNRRDKIWGQDVVAEGAGFREEGTWHLLDPDQYSLVGGGGYIILEQNINERHALAVSFRTASGEQFGQTQGDTLQLKLIKPRDARPRFPTWNLEWKNVYQIATGFSTGRRFDRKTIEVQVFKEVPGREPQASQSGDSYLELLGLDREGQDPGTPPDRLIDANYAGLDEFRGLLIFPDQRPFDPQVPPYKDALDETVPQLYDSQQQRDQIEASKYFIQVVSGSAQQRISLGLGVRPETVEVLLNGERLQRGRDYNVGFAGDVQFTRTAAERVASPGADLEISYESENVFGLGSQQKTLLGMRTEYQFLDGNGTLGGTLIYNNQRTGENRIRVGNEPARTIVWDMDLKAKFDAPILTRMVDALPLLKTAEDSEISLQAEVARSQPNLNTKGTGFIDDFEGSERPNSLPVLRTRWVPSSLPPDGVYNPDNRGPLRWYNPIDQVLRTDIWPNQEDQIDPQNSDADVLTLELKQREDSFESWGGVMTALSAVTDLSRSKFLEIWIKGDRGRLEVDLGQISEDYFPLDDPNGRLDTEDDPFGGLTTGDGVASPEEDIGIDRLDDREEIFFFVRSAGLDTVGLGVLEDRPLRERFRQLQAENPGSILAGRDPADPAGDNWAYDRTRDKNNYNRINGTQNNGNESGGTRPDSEDLNNDGNLNTRNAYYHYSVDLSDPLSPFLVADTRNDKGWRQYRLPLYDEKVVVRQGSPDSTRIEFARLVLSAADTTFARTDSVRAQIALMELIGNDWQEDEIEALDQAFPVDPDIESLDITVIGTDKSLTYVQPPGVKVRRNPTTRTREREQSLVFNFDELGAGHQASATKVLSRNANYTKYTRMRMYVHGGDSLEVRSTPQTNYLHSFDLNIELATELDMRFIGDQLRTTFENNGHPLSPAAYIEPLNTGTSWSIIDRQDDEPRFYSIYIPRRSERLVVDVSDLELFVRFGSDSGNYYEVFAPVFPEWDNDLRQRNWDGNQMDIDLVRLSQLKGLLQEAPASISQLDTVITTSRLRDGEPAVYRVRGNPSMQQIRQLTVGLRNRGTDQSYSGQVYIDELRLDQARNDAGVAAYMGVKTQLGGFMNIDTDLTWQDENFRTLNSTERNNSDLQASFKTSTNLHQLMPGRWGFNAPLKVSLSKRESQPRFSPNSDVELTTEQRRQQRTERTKEFVEISFSKRQGRNWFWRWTLDQVNLRASYSKERAFSPTLPLDDRDSQALNFSYQMPLPKPEVEVLKWMPEWMPEKITKITLQPLPSTMSYTMAANRFDQATLRRTETDTTFVERFTLNETYTSKAALLPGLSADYTLRVNRDLRKKFDPGALSFGREIGRNQRTELRFTPRLVKWLDQNYTFSSTYEETNDPSQRRGQVLIDTTTGLPAPTRDATTNNSLSARGSLKVNTLFKNDRTRRRGRGGDDDPDEPAEPFFLWRLLGWTTGMLDPVSANWRRDLRSRHFNLVARPHFLFQLGLRDSLEVAQVRGAGLTQQDNNSRTDRIDMSSGVKLPLGFSVKTSFDRRDLRRTGNTQNRLTVERQEKLPKVILSWSNANQVPLIKRFLRNAQVNLSYDESKTQQGENNLQPGNLTREGTSTQMQASWRGKMTLGPTLTLERRQTEGVDFDYELGQVPDDLGVPPPKRGSSGTNNNKTTLRLKHVLRPTGLPLLGKLKSNVDLTLELGLESEERTSAVGDNPRVRIGGTDKTKAQLNAVYSFSQNFRGRGILRWENNTNTLTEKTRKIREVRLSGTLFWR
ncbi:MAG: hypothetical protein GKR89_25415 [Candidatus Latescibacteria bacterium]|nr:hypothetical protein [Candidatus Latescibacterota bacterium]